MSLTASLSVTLLGPTDGRSVAAPRLSALVNLLRELGVATQVVTQPAQLAIADAPGPRIVIIDGLSSAEYDVPYLIAVLRAHRRMGIIVVVDDHAQRLQAVRAGADLGWLFPIRADALRIEIQALAVHYAAPARPEAAAAPVPVVSSGTEAAPATDAERNVVYLKAAGAEPVSDRETRMAREPTPGQPLAVVRTAGRKSDTPARSNADWRLTYRGWMLIAPNEKSVPLTLTERTFVMSLFRHPDRRLSYETWKRSRVDETDTVHSLTAMVYRLRRKCALAGMRLPLRVEHGRGYQFVESCEIDDGVPPPEIARATSASALPHTPLATGRG